jgi:hypothetical protein
MQLAFDIASKEIGIPDLLDVEDVCDVPKPDERSLMTYIAYWFHAFSQMERVENAGRRVEKFVANMQGAWQMQNDFERRMRELLGQIAKQRSQWEEATFDGTYADARAQSAEFTAWKRKSKRTWVAEKSDLVGLLGNIRTKLATYRLRPYDPPAELSLEALDNAWTGLMKAERQRSQIINETIRDIKNALRKSFADKANDFALALNTLSTSISALEGEVDDQLEHTKEISKSLAPLDEYLNIIASIDEQCAEANIEENDFTTYTYDELEYELGLVRNSVSKKLAFLENQMVARNMTNLTPIQLEEFESVFRHFDRDVSNSLAELEFSAALASLGLVYDEEEMHERFRETSGGKDFVTFEQFIRFMVDETEDQNTAEQVFESFREVADGKVSHPCNLLYAKGRTLNSFYSRTSQNSTFDIPLSPTRSSTTFLPLCPSTRVQICKKTAISPNLTTLPTCSGTWALPIPTEAAPSRLMATSTCLFLKTSVSSPQLLYEGLGWWKKD